MIKINGKVTEAPSETTVKEMLLQNGYSLTRIAVERNGNILPKALYEDTRVEEGDVFEVVQFVGGG